MEIPHDKLVAELDYMRELIRTDLDVFNKFDLNGDGEIDGAEWAAVERLVVERLRREAAELERATAIMNGENPPAAEEAQPEASEPGKIAERVMIEDLVPAYSGQKILSKQSGIENALALDFLVVDAGEDFEIAGADYSRFYGLRNKRNKVMCSFGARFSGPTKQASGDAEVEIAVLDEDGLVTHKIEKRGNWRIATVAGDDIGTLTFRHNTLSSHYDATWEGGEGTIKYPWFTSERMEMKDASGVELGKIEFGMAMLDTQFDSMSAVQVRFIDEEQGYRWPLVLAALINVIQDDQTSGAAEIGLGILDVLVDD